MLWSAGLEAPKRVWVHGFMTLQGERMSKSRGNFFDPNAMVAALGADGARYGTLREVPFDRDADVSWDTFVRRYNADLANDFGNLVNRTLAMTARYLDGERPDPARRRPHWLGRGAPRAGWRAGLDACLRAALAAMEFVGAANRYVDAEQPWALARLGHRRRHRRPGWRPCSATCSRARLLARDRAPAGDPSAWRPSWAASSRTARTAMAARRSIRSWRGTASRGEDQPRRRSSRPGAEAEALAGA
jgi:methionyl-tRNA synthetase